MPLHKTQFNRKHEHCRTAWRIFIPVKQFKQPGTKTMHRPMNRLAAHACASGSFWAEPRKCKIAHTRQRIHTLMIIQGTIG